MGRGRQGRGGARQGRQGLSGARSDRPSPGGRRRRAGRRLRCGHPAVARQPQSRRHPADRRLRRLRTAEKLETKEKDMTFRVLDPTAGEAAATGQRAPRLPTLKGKTVGFISNGKVGTKGFFAHLEKILREEY